MPTIAVVGVDIAKSVFQIHAIDGDGAVVARRQLRRGEVMRFFERLSPCLVGMEACASAHPFAAVGADRLATGSTALLSIGPGDHGARS
jgi:transposase